MKSIFVIVLALFVVMAMVPEINGLNLLVFPESSSGVWIES
ncbi:hypothetical protein KGM_210228 [Danaus plexippus plexippus]|uniref:Uncharacterized protein n=1 Tax=Danaus plexippus plexippus TaxID=278856 RepID=A0A212F4X7_DANPL|nr:hypothetical protein KGM_210228 [Danaus plexippus plexippus]